MIERFKTLCKGFSFSSHYHFWLFLFIVVTISLNGLVKAKDNDLISQNSNSKQGGPVENTSLYSASITGSLIYPGTQEDKEIVVSNDGTLVASAPQIEGKASSNQNKGSKLLNLKGYFALPVIGGLNKGKLHDLNAVDIANTCGTPVLAAADGLVVPDSELGDGSEGWNNGYGIFILIEHPNGTQTRYAHLTKTLTSMGSIVAKGDKIGLMGATGNSGGPKNCHLHFEVVGARNPFVK